MIFRKKRPAIALPSEVSVQELKHAAESGRRIFVLDVRTECEYQESHLSFTDLLVPYDVLDSLLDELPHDKQTEIYCFCRSGRRSGIAADYLRFVGYKNSFNVTGGILAWRKAGYEVVSGD